MVFTSAELRWEALQAEGVKIPATEAWPGTGQEAGSHCVEAILEYTRLFPH